MKKCVSHGYERRKQPTMVFMHSCYTIFIEILMKPVMSPLGAFHASVYIIVKKWEFITALHSFFRASKMNH